MKYTVKTENMTLTFDDPSSVQEYESDYGEKVFLFLAQKADQAQSFPHNQVKGKYVLGFNPDAKSGRPGETFLQGHLCEDADELVRCADYLPSLPRTAAHQMLQEKAKESEFSDIKKAVAAQIESLRPKT